VSDSVLVTLAQQVGEANGKLDQLLARETTQDKRMDGHDAAIRGIQKRQWVGAGVVAAFAFLTVRWEFLKALIAASPK
jgi:hypothetical protein